MRLILEKRLDTSAAETWRIRGISLVLALAAGALLLFLVGANPITTYRAMAVGALGTPYAISETLVKAIPLMLTGLAVAVAFRMLFWNIGAEGQLAMGGFAAAGVALFGPPALPWVPLVLWLPIVLAAGFLAGAFWGVIPALLRAYLDVNEIITTLMLNYVAILWVEHLYYGPWRDPEGFGFPGTALFPIFTWLPRLSGRVHLGLGIALVAAALLWFLLGRTRWGYEIRLLGANPTAARYAGIPVARNMVLVMVLSGGLAGLAGMAEVSGVAHRLGQGLTVGYGFTAIIVAWLARLNPWGVLVVAFSLAALLVGGDQLQIQMGLPAAIGLVLQGVIFFFVLGGDIFTRYRARLVGASGERIGGADLLALIVGPLHARRDRASLPPPAPPDDTAPRALYQKPSLLDRLRPAARDESDRKGTPAAHQVTRAPTLLEKIRGSLDRAAPGAVEQSREIGLTVDAPSEEPGTEPLLTQDDAGAEPLELDGYLTSAPPVEPPIGGSTGLTVPAIEESGAMTTRAAVESDPPVPPVSPEPRGRGSSPGPEEPAAQRGASRPTLLTSDEQRARSSGKLRKVRHDDATTSEAYLESIESPRHYPLRLPTMKVGRASTRDARNVPRPDLIDLRGESAAKTVSRNHARVALRDQRWVIIPNPESQNLTLLNGEPVPIGEERPLSDGDTLQLGAVQLVFHDPQHPSPRPSGSSGGDE